MSRSEPTCAQQQPRLLAPNLSQLFLDDLPTKNTRPLRSTAEEDLPWYVLRRHTVFLLDSSKLPLVNIQGVDVSGAA